ncbi:MAG: VWA domain-containing protein [Desulfobacteraceae bacterium]|nr:VWA domain-containing protein [Desulfobacteraceae bacterium]
MTFASIKMLFLIWVIPVFILLYLYGGRRRQKILKAFAGENGLTRLAPLALAGRRRLRAFFLLAAVTLAILAAAGPRYGFHWQEVKSKGIDLIIALDCSRSMLAKDIQPTRLARAKREILDLLGMLQGDRAGLVAFSGTAFVQCPMTLDTQAFNLFLKVLGPDYLPVGGTDLAAAVRTAVNAFDPKSPAEKAILLITDGEQTGRDDPLEAAKQAAQKNIKLFCIGVGSGDGVPLPENRGGFKKDASGNIVVSRLDETTLSAMAGATGGIYTRSVAGDMDLEAIYRDQIRSKMEQTETESGRRQVWADRFQWPLTISVLLIFCALWLPPVRQASVICAALWLFCPVSVSQAGPLQKGQEAFEQEKYQKAVEHFTKGQLNSPDNPAVLYNLGNAYYKAGNFDTAQEHYDQALNKAEPKLKSKIHYNMGNAAYRQKNFQSAVQHYEKTLKLTPDDTKAKENLAFVKKRIQEQKKQQDSSKDQKKDQQKKQQQQQQQQNQQSGEQDRPEDQKDQQPQQPEEPEKQQNQAQPDEKKHQPAAKDQQSSANQLNRLKDEPGKAIIPQYQKRQVEKDW